MKSILFSFFPHFQSNHQVRSSQKTIKTFALVFMGVLCLSLSQKSLAASAGGHSIGAGLIVMTPSQDDLNLLIQRANTREGGISTSSLNNAYELNVFYQYRFSGSMFALQFKPSYFLQSSTGSGTSGKFNYSLDGFTVFPMLRMFPLENNYIKFLIQVGLGYGALFGRVDEAAANVSFHGSTFGYQAGLGAEFCFNANHCVSIEGNIRYLPISRNVASSQSGTWAADSISQPNAGDITKNEVELDGSDLATTLSGIQGQIGYIFTF